MTRDQSNQQNTHGVPDQNPEADTASGGAPEEPDTTADHHRTGDEPAE